MVRSQWFLDTCSGIIIKQSEDLLPDEFGKDENGLRRKHYDKLNRSNKN